MAREHIACGFDVKAVGDDGVFKGYGSIFGNVDSYGDVIVAGAFAESIQALKAKNRMPALLWQHRSSEPIGVYTDVREDSVGLYVEGRLALKTARGAEAYELLKMGAISGMSIGYVTREDSYDKLTQIRTLKKLDLWEVSLVTFPANDMARVDGVKAGDLGPKEFERLLRDAGLSRSEAKALMSGGYQALTQRDAVDSDLTSELDNLIKQLRS